MQDVFATVISQYSNAPTLTQLILNFNQYIDPTANFDLWYNTTWNVYTAVGAGLDTWGNIVGVQRVLQVPQSVYFGFAEAEDLSQAGFNQAPFFSGGNTTGNFALSDDVFRQLILAKALANICDGSIPAINAILMLLFGSQGQAWVTDNASMYFGFAEAMDDTEYPFNQQPFYAGSTGYGMFMTYTFDFQLSPVDFAIVSQSGVLPKPVGVSASIVQL